MWIPRHPLPGSDDRPDSKSRTPTTCSSVSRFEGSGKFAISTPSTIRAHEDLVICSLALCIRDFSAIRHGHIRLKHPTPGLHDVSAISWHRHIRDLLHDALGSTSVTVFRVERVLRWHHWELSVEPFREYAGSPYTEKHQPSDTRAQLRSLLECYLRICDLFFDLLSYMTTPALVVLPVVVKFVALRLQSDRWMWRVSTIMHIWCMAQVCA